MMRRNFITGEWEDAPDDLSGTWVVRDGRVVRAGENGVRVKRQQSSCSAYCSKRPWVSRSMGVHPRRRDYVNRKAKELGMHFQINERGFATGNSAKSKRDAMRYFSDKDGPMVNFDGGYGDVCP